MVRRLRWEDGYAAHILTEDDVLSVEPRGDNGGDEKLRAVRVRASVGHGEEVRLIVLELEVLIWKQRRREVSVSHRPRHMCAETIATYRQTSRRRWTCHRCRCDA